MRTLHRMVLAVSIGLTAGLLAPSMAAAHSASDAYLTLDTATGANVQGQWDIALRDLDFVLGLDADGNGELTWGEVQRRQADIARYALAHLALRSGGRACPITLTRQVIDDHADGAYAALFFQARCAGSKGNMTLDYHLFFDIDPSHRAIFVSHQGQETATAVLSPENATITLTLKPLAH